MQYLQILPDETIINKIFLIRGERVMMDRDLADLYGVDTRSLNQSVKRKINRFPEDFMFQLTPKELKNWKSQIVISKLASHKEILKKLEMLERKDIEQDNDIILIFEYLKQLEQTKLEETAIKERKLIGFKTKDK